MLEAVQDSGTGVLVLVDEANVAVRGFFFFLEMVLTRCRTPPKPPERCIRTCLSVVS